MFCCESGMQSKGMPCKLNLMRGNEEMNGTGNLAQRGVQLQRVCVTILNSRVEWIGGCKTDELGHINKVRYTCFTFEPSDVHSEHQLNHL